MLAEERRKRLLEALKSTGALSVADAEQRLGVSRMTVHRDFDVLANAGLLRKVHGGAVAVEDIEGTDRWAKPFEERSKTNARAKRTIAKHLLKLVGDAQSFILDASSTAHVFAELLAERINAGKQAECFVVTGGLHLFNKLACTNPLLRLSLHGGEPHPRTGTLIGPIALASLREVRCDWAVFSAASYMQKEGDVFDATPEEAEIKRAYFGAARQKVLALDSSKFEVSAPFRLTGADDFDAIVTENGILEN